VLAFISYILITDNIISYVAAAATFMFVTLSFGELGPNTTNLFATEPETTASGLLWLSELIEEHSRIAKTVGKKGIYVCLSLSVTHCAYAYDFVI
jgi:synaptojanin